MGADFMDDKNIFSLTDDEWTLIEKYRSLSEKWKKSVLLIVDTFEHNHERYDKTEKQENERGIIIDFQSRNKTS
jgi:hypothetical protein